MRAQELSKYQPEWMNELITQDNKTDLFKQTKEDILEIPRVGKKIYDLFDAAFDCVGFSSTLLVCPLSGQGSVKILEFEHPALLCASKTAPLMMLVGNGTVVEEKYPQKIMIEKNPEVPKVCLSWFEQVASSPASFLKKVKDITLGGVAAYKSKDDSRAGEKIVKNILGRDFVCLGFVSGSAYTKIKEKGEYLHPYGQPTLLFQLKGAPVFFKVSPSIRFNKSILSEVPANKYREEVVGITS